MRAPQAAGDDIAVLAQKPAIGRDTRPQHFGAVVAFTVHFSQQRVADIFIK